MKILLIAGHGNGDCGATGCGYKEADLTREVVSLVKPKLATYATVDIADTTKNWYQHICQKGNSFNFKAYDYVLEVHFNACVNDTKGNGDTTGTEIYVTTSEKGTSVEDNIVKNISALGFKNRGVKRKNWSLINHIKKQGVSSALLETCFIDDADDMKIYKAKKDQIAEAITSGIVKAFGLKKKEVKKVETGKFSDIKGHWAEGVINEVAKTGIINGFTDGTFRPDNPLTRGQAVVLIRNLLNYLSK